MQEPSDRDLMGVGPEPSVMNRRRALALFGAGLAALAGCGSSSSTGSGASSTSIGSSTTADTASTSAATTATCTPIPDETAGPYPGDGSNGPDVLSEGGVVRRDIRSSFGSASGTADGVPLDIQLTVVDTANGCEPLAGAAVYLWHCDREGRYSLYSSGVEDQNYLRGVQAASSDGALQFTTIFPAAYAGRWPHIHFEIFPSLDAATAASSRITTSQLALPVDVCETVYATDGYEQSVRNLAGSSLDTDNVFRDGHDLQLATVTGNVDDGFVAALTVAV